MFSTPLEKVHPRMFDDHHAELHAERNRDTLCPLLGKVFGEAVECTSLKVSLRPSFSSTMPKLMFCSSRSQHRKYCRNDLPCPPNTSITSPWRV